MIDRQPLSLRQTKQIALNAGDLLRGELDLRHVAVPRTDTFGEFELELLLLISLQDGPQVRGASEGACIALGQRVTSAAVCFEKSPSVVPASGRCSGEKKRDYHSTCGNSNNAPGVTC